MKPQWGLGSEKGPRVVRGSRSQIRQLREADALQAAFDPPAGGGVDGETGAPTTEISDEQMAAIVQQEAKSAAEGPPDTKKKR